MFDPKMNGRKNEAGETPQENTTAARKLNKTSPVCPWRGTSGMVFLILRIINVVIEISSFPSAAPLSGAPIKKSLSDYITNF
jgi:hypothetical protein